MDEAHFDQASVEQLLEHYVHPCVNSSRVRKLRRSEELESEILLSIYAQDLASLGSLKSSRGFQIKEQFVGTSNPWVNVYLGREEAGDSFRSSPCLPS
jgi:hypothetical protein